MLITLINLLKERHLTLTTCESCTGGLLASLITEIPSVSSVYLGSIITYATRIKNEVVGVDEMIIKKFGVISEETVAEMAAKTCLLMQSDLCISFSGNAGPQAMEEKPIGLVCYAICFHQFVKSYTSQYYGNREEIKQAVILDAIEKCIQIVQEYTN